MNKPRTSTIERNTKETQIKLALSLDGGGESRLDTGIPFLDHMLALWARHGLFDLELEGRGDLEVDLHHLVEDTGICLGLALKQALGDKQGIQRYGWAAVPMDESLVLAAADLSGRGFLSCELDLRRRRIGQFDTELVEEFLRALAHSAGMTLHVRQLAGRNTHHVLEAAFKALAKALDQATRVDQRVSGVPSTKGML